MLTRICHGDTDLFSSEWISEKFSKTSREVFADAVTTSQKAGNILIRLYLVVEDFRSKESVHKYYGIINHGQSNT